MYQNDRRGINFSKTWFWSNFEVKTDRLKGLGGSKCDRKSSGKIKRAHHVELCET